METKECLGVIKVKTVFSTATKPDIREGIFIHRSLDAKNTFNEIFRTTFQIEKDAIIDKKEEIFIKNVDMLSREQKIDLLLAWNGGSFLNEAKDAVPFEKDDDGYDSALLESISVIKNNKKEEYNKLSQEDLEKTVIEEGKKQLSLAPAMENAYKYLIFETFRNPKSPKQRVFDSSEDVGESISDKEFNRLIELRTEFDQLSISDEEIKK